jgi:hypothetical protein
MNPTQLAAKLVRGDYNKRDVHYAAILIRDLHAQVRDQGRRTDSLAFDIAHTLRNRDVEFDADEAALWYRQMTKIITDAINLHDDKWGRIQ